MKPAFFRTGEVHPRGWSPLLDGVFQNLLLFIPFYNLGNNALSDCAPSGPRPGFSGSDILLKDVQVPEIPCHTAGACAYIAAGGPYDLA